MRKSTIATSAVLAVAGVLVGCGNSEEPTPGTARKAFVAECTAAGAGDAAETDAAKRRAYCECMADPTLAMQARRVEGMAPDAAERETMRNAAIACRKHLE